MAKRKPASSENASADDAADNTELEAAVEEVRAARERLRAARAKYEEVLRTAAGEVADEDRSTLEAALTQTLDLVKKYPGPGLICAGIVGFFLGRLFRR